MGQFFVCSHCNRILEAPEKGGGDRMICPGCERWVLLPAASADAADKQEQATRIACPECGSTLKLVRQLAGLRVRCNTCQTPFTVSVDPWELTPVSTEVGRSTEEHTLVPPVEESMEPLFLDEDDAATEEASTSEGDPADRELATVAAAWRSLPVAMRIGILAMIRAVTEEDRHPLDFLH